MKKCLTIFLILAVLLLTVACGKYKDAKYAWVLVETETNEEEWQYNLARHNEDEDARYNATLDSIGELYSHFIEDIEDGDISYIASKYHYEIDVEKNSVIFTTSFVTHEVDDSSHRHRDGDTISGKVTWETPPSIIEGPEFEFSLQGTVELINRNGDNMHNDYELHGYYEHLSPDGHELNYEIMKPDGYELEKGSYILQDSFYNELHSSEDNNYKECQSSLSGKLLWPNEEGERSTIVLMARDSQFTVTSKYIYEWQEL